MSNSIWHCECAVEAGVTPAFAWSFWTDVRNWSDPPAEFELEGAFVPGARGTTRIPGQEPVHWTVAAVDPGKSAAVVIQLDGAQFCFSMRFDPIPGGRTRITQRIELSGEKGSAYLGAAEMFRTNQAPGLQKLAETMAGRAGPQQPDSGLPSEP